MASWLTDDVKQLLIQPCFAVAERIGYRLDSHIKMRQDIDERALTEDLADSFDSSSDLNTWGTSLRPLRDRQIFISTRVQKSTREFKIGVDIGIAIKRSFYGNNQVKADYACLSQCKKVDVNGFVSDFFHQIHSTNNYQSSLMLDITPSLFYFIYTPPSMVKLEYTLEPVVFARANLNCSSPIWNMGDFEYGGVTFPFLSESQKRLVSSILVIPALAVDTQINKDNKVDFHDLLPNCIPFWYCFAELLVPGFIGDPKSQVISIAPNVKGGLQDSSYEFGGQFP